LPVSGEKNLSSEGASLQEPIAIIGMACIFPEAPDLRTFWRNILASVDAVGEPDPEWEARRYLDYDRIKTHRGGYLRDLFRFDPREFGIMPNSVDGGEPDQFLALRVAKEALLDAGYSDPSFDHGDTGIVLGHSTYLHRGQVNLVQHNIALDQALELLSSALPGLDESKLAEVREYLESRLPQFNADIAPGLVPNVMTGRIANRLNLKGPNYLIDAACASSLLAVASAIDELRNGRSRLMLAGGVNASLPAEASVIFTQLGTLTGKGRVRPFAVGSDGTLLGEGLGMVVLKRMTDAMADNDRVYAVIHGVGQASDGRGQGLLAPSVEGEALALRRAYEATGLDPAGVELIEAHGTGIFLGDKTEIAALKSVLGERRGAQGTVAIGSIKSMISHCIPAAGIAGLIKTALALHHGVLPPTLCEEVNPELGIRETPLYINTAPRPWIDRPDGPRRAGVNAFGFGGINSHAILEEAPASALSPPSLSAWPRELCVFSASDDAALREELARVAAFLEGRKDSPLSDVAATLADRDRAQSHRLAVVARDSADLLGKIEQSLRRLQEGEEAGWATRKGICYSREPLAGKIAFMFPGEGSQYLGMFEDLTLHLPEFRRWFGFWRGLYADGPGECRTDIVFPPAGELDEGRRRELEERLHGMDVGSEAVFVGAQAMNDLLTRLGVRPDVMVGHSTGESAALAAAGAIPADDLDVLADSVRELNRIYRGLLEDEKIPTGALLTVGALSHATVGEHLARLDGGVVVAMDNCPNQQVLFGERDAIDVLRRSLSEAGGICVLLPFDRGYHTSRFAAVSAAFLDYYKGIGLRSPRTPLYSCSTADLFPKQVAAVRRLAAEQWATPVRFRETVEKMYSDGVRYFVEVGPSGNLSAFVNDILAGREYLALPSDSRRLGGFEQFLSVLGRLYVNAKGVDPARLFESRSRTPVPLEGDSHEAAGGMYLRNTMPRIRFDERDQVDLREMLVPAAGARRPDRAEEPVAGADEAGEEGLFAEHCRQMRSLLDQQESALASWDATRRRDAPDSRHADARESRPIDEIAPFLSAVIERDERSCRAECVLSPAEDRFLRHHVLSGPVSAVDPELLGLSCVPLMVSLEIMAEACALTAGSVSVKAIENIKAFNWAGLDDGELRLDVWAELVDPERRVFAARIGNGSEVVVTADFVFEAEWRAAGLPPLGEKRPPRWSGQELYSTGMFHGPIFRSIARIDGWNEGGIDAALSSVSLDGFFTENERPRLVLNPVLLDAMGQLAAFWIAEQVGTGFNSFPSTIDRIELYRDCPRDLTGLILTARRRPLDPTAVAGQGAESWDFECVDGDGKPLLRAVNLVNVYFPVPDRFYRVRLDPLRGRLGEPFEGPNAGQELLWQLPHLSEEFCAQSSGIFLRILAHALLSSEERGEWRDLDAAERRLHRWLFGRACLKEAVRHWVFKLTGELLYPADIVVRHDGSGAPSVDGWWVGEVVPAPAVSLSHSRGRAFAAVAGPGRAIGVDVTSVDEVSSPDLIEGALAESEREAIRRFSEEERRERVARLWCAKEAAAKVLGTGLLGRPEAFVVSFEDSDWRRGTVGFDETCVGVSLAADGDLVVALASEPSGVTSRGAPS
jgi:acyl transferase domain-containing protein/phosphopantetheinyl transferase (holo-ACP synthase)